MTKIFLHGILGVKFKKTFVAKIDKIEDVFGFLKANNPKFEKEICDMHLNGVNYCLIVDGKKIKTKEELSLKKRPKEVHLVPILVGHGPYAAIAIVVAKALLYIIALFIVITLLTSKPPKPPSLEQSTKALEESYGINNKPNITAQGTQVPVGYGRLLIGTHVIEYAEKNYPQNIRANEIFGNGIKDKYLGGKLDRVKSGIVFPGEKPDNVEVWGQDSSFQFEQLSYFDPLRCPGFRTLQIEGIGTHLAEFHDDPNHRLKVYRWNQSSSYNHRNYSQQSLGSAFWSNVFYMNGNGGIQQRVLTPYGINTGFPQYNYINFLSNTPWIGTESCIFPFESPYWGGSTTWTVTDSIRIVVTDYDQKPGYDPFTDSGPPGIIRAEFSIRFSTRRTVIFGQTGTIPQDLDQQKLFYWQTSNSGKPSYYPNYGSGPLTRFGATNGQAPSISNGRLI